MTSLVTRDVKTLPISENAEVKELIQRLKNLVNDLEYNRQNVDMWANRVNRMTYDLMFGGM